MRSSIYVAKSFYTFYTIQQLLFRTYPIFFCELAALGMRALGPRQVPSQFLFLFGSNVSNSPHSSTETVNKTASDWEEQKPYNYLGRFMAYVIVLICRYKDACAGNLGLWNVVKNLSSLRL
jgi:hypothetical protein